MNVSFSLPQCSQCKGFCTVRHRLPSKNNSFSSLIYTTSGIFVMYYMRDIEKLRMKTFPLKIIGVLPKTSILPREFIGRYLSRSKKILIQLLSLLLISGLMLVCHSKLYFKVSQFSTVLNSPATTFRSQRENLQPSENSAINLGPLVLHLPLLFWFSHFKWPISSYYRTFVPCLY